MGQKSNPNSFNRANYLTQFHSGFNNSFEYFHLFKDVFFLKQVIVKLFARNKCFVQECEVLINSQTGHMVVYLSFLVLKPNVFKLPKVTRRSKFLPRFIVKREKPKQDALKTNLILERLRKTFAAYGYKLPIFFVFKNLTIYCKTNRKTKEKLQNIFGRFRKLPFFRAGLLVFLLLSRKKAKPALLLAFITRFLKLLHRSKKINMFFQFIREMLKRLNNLQGLKLKIKGRFRKASRSKTRIFSHGALPLQTVDSRVFYAHDHVFTSYGVFGVKI